MTIPKSLSLMGTKCSIVLSHYITMKRVRLTMMIVPVMPVILTQAQKQLGVGSLSVAPTFTIISMSDRMRWRKNKPTVGLLDSLVEMRSEILPIVAPQTLEGEPQEVPLLEAVQI